MTWHEVRDVLSSMIGLYRELTGDLDTPAEVVASAPFLDDVLAHVERPPVLPLPAR